MIFKDYYKILGLESCKVTNEEIRVAYRDQAKKYHPDVIGRDNFSEERFKDINEAYKVLSNITTRKKYDRMWNMHVGRRKVNVNNKKAKGTFSGDVMNMLFGINNTSSSANKKVTRAIEPIRGEDVETQIDVSIYEAFFGMEKKISLRTVNGKMKTFTVKIPAGIRNGEKIRLLGQGKAGENGGKNGDLFVKINLKDDKKFKIMGNNIYTNIYLTPWEAALGAKIDVSAIDENISLLVPQGIESGEKITIPNKGYKDGQGGRGELVAEVKIMIPKHLTSDEKELFNKLSKTTNFKPREIYS